jgi:diadenosine tetraphosphate (Ap4A) HIT family hydrolase
MNGVTDQVDSLPTWFASPGGLRAAFEDRLQALLDSDQLGAFILVLANASFEPALFERLRDVLGRRFDQWCGLFDRRDPRAVGAAADDVEVFQRLRELGFENLLSTRHRVSGPWELQFNPLRALRPPRMSRALVETLYRPFDASGFHFNKPFLRDEILWEGQLAGTDVRLLFNKFPFAELHGLLVPEPGQDRPQFLTAAEHASIWRITQRLGDKLPGIGFGYNAQGGFSSVNHLHFQMFMRSHGSYPIEAAEWRHNGGRQDYPLTVLVHDQPGTAWSAIDLLHSQGTAYNLLYRPDRVYIVARAAQGSYSHSRWTGGFAWAEVAGALTLFDADDFDSLNAVEIEQEFARLRVTP